MKKKNGFTLIELLATILLVSIVFSISTYFVINTINTSKDKANKTALNGIKKSANLYIEEYPENIIWNNNSTCVYIGDLVEYGYLKETQIKGFDTYLILKKNENNTIIKEQLDTEGICKDNKSGIRIPTSKECIKNLIYQPNEEQTLITSRNNDEYEVINAIGTNAGEYHITAKLKKENTTWKDGTTEDKIVTCSIKKATPTLSITPKESSEIVGAKTEITLTSNVSGTLVIKSTNQDFAKGTLENNTIEKEKSLKATIESLATRDIPTYINITLTPDDNKNYNNITNTYTIKSINKGKALIPTKEEYCKDLTYNGETQELVKAPEIGFTFKNTKGKEVGTYTITAQLNYGYIWIDKDGKEIDTKDKTFTCNIKEKEVNTYKITLDKGNCKENGTEEITATENSSTITPTTITRAKSTYTINGFELDAKRNSDGATVSSTNPITTSSYANKYYTTKNGNTPILDVTSDGTPSWTNNTIANYLKEGTWIGTSEKTIYAKCNNQTVTLPEITKTNHTCGWTQLKTGTTIQFQSKEQIQPQEDITLYGICIKNAPTTYTVKFTSSTTSCPLDTTNYANINATYDTNIKNSAITNPTCTGYTFTGWTASGNFDITTAKIGTKANEVTTAWTNNNKATFFKNLSTTSEGIVTLTANWTPIQYNVIYKLNKDEKDLSEGEGIGTPQKTCTNPSKIYYDEEFTICTPTNKDNYYFFGGWEITSTANIQGAYRYYKVKNPGPNQEESNDINDLSEYVTIKSDTHIGDGTYTKILLKNLTKTNNATITLTATWRKKNWYVHESNISGGNQQDGHALYTGLLTSAIQAAKKVKDDNYTQIDLIAPAEKEAQGHDYPSISKNIKIYLKPGTEYSILNRENIKTAIAINTENKVRIIGTGILKNDTGYPFNINNFISNSGELNIAGGNINYLQNETNATEEKTVILNNGTLNISNGTINIKNTNKNNKNLSGIQSFSNLNITGGEIKGDGQNAHVYLIEAKNGNMTVNNSTINKETIIPKIIGEGNSDLLNVVNNNNMIPKVTINNGIWTKSGEGLAINVSSGNVTLNDGIIENTNSTAQNPGKTVLVASNTSNKAKITISGGAIIGNKSTTLQIGNESNKYGTAIIQGGIIENDDDRPTIQLESEEGDMIDAEGKTRVLTIKQNSTIGPRIKHKYEKNNESAAILITAPGFSLMDRMNQYTNTSNSTEGYIWSNKGYVIKNIDTQKQGLHFKYGGSLLSENEKYTYGNGIQKANTSGFTQNIKPYDANTNYGN